MRYFHRHRHRRRSFAAKPAAVAVVSATAEGVERWMRGAGGVREGNAAFIAITIYGRRRWTRHAMTVSPNAPFKLSLYITSYPGFGPGTPFPHSTPAEPRNFSSTHIHRSTILDVHGNFPPLSPPDALALSSLPHAPLVALCYGVTLIRCWRWTRLDSSGLV